MICKEVPFKKMTKKAGFQPVILEEMRRRGIQLSEEEKTYIRLQFGNSRSTLVTKDTSHHCFHLRDSNGTDII